jgi:dihydroorotate dehydrogenase electron transfer subunit
MTSSLHAAFCPDRAVQRTVEIIENVRLAKDTYRVRFVAPELAQRITPGQFLMLRLADVNDPLIGRPLALYDTAVGESGQPEFVDVVYLVKGKLTSRLWQMRPGQRIDIWGPLGNGFGVQGSGFNVQESVKKPPVSTEHLILVAGGIGFTPFLALAREALQKKTYGNPPRSASCPRHITYCYGARSAEYFAGLEDFQRLGIEVRLATDDGSRGHHGLVTDLLQQALAERHGRPHVICCGPEPMMAAVARIAHRAGATCEVSLETPMACGIGICFTCVARIRDSAGGWDWKRTCVEGPVFDAEMIEW